MTRRRSIRSLLDDLESDYVLDDVVRVTIRRNEVDENGAIVDRNEKVVKIENRA